MWTSAAQRSLCARRYKQKTPEEKAALKREMNIALGNKLAERTRRQMESTKNMDPIREPESYDGKSNAKDDVIGTGAGNYYPATVTQAGMETAPPADSPFAQHPEEQGAERLPIAITPREINEANRKLWKTWQ